MSDKPVLVPFGPTRSVPKGHRWCFSCDGSGEDSIKDGKPCKICKGKGHWNANDIREYHEKYPKVCHQSCGEQHVEPHFGPLPRDHQKVKALFAEVDALLKKYEK